MVSLWQELKSRMMEHPEQTVSERDAKMTYEELVIFAEAFSEKLKGERCCAIYCDSEFATAIALLACFAAGVTAVPLSSRYGERHCQKILRHLSPTCVIVDDREGFGIYRISDSAYTPPRKHPALILYTSGTAGTPKGAMLPERSILANLRSIREYYRLNETDSILIARPLYHAAVLTGEFLLGVCAGARIVFSSAPFHPTAVLRFIREECITAFGATPTLLRLLTRFLPKNEVLPLKHLVVSGECMSKNVGKELLAAFPHTAIYHVYGLTEAAPRVSYLPPEEFGRICDSVGIPLSGVCLRICDPLDSGKQQKRGTEGLLWVRGENVMSGYYNNPELTGKVLRHGWLCTGDIAVMDRRRFLWIRGRADDLIIRAGMNIYPAEVENELRQDPRTRDVLVYSVKDGAGNVQIALDISGNFENEKEVRALCISRLPAYEVPATIRLVPDIPRNGSGKVIRYHENTGI